MDFLHLAAHRSEPLWTSLQSSTQKTRGWHNCTQQAAMATQHLHHGNGAVLSKNSFHHQKEMPDSVGKLQRVAGL